MTTAPGRMFTDEHLTAMEPVLAVMCADFGASLVKFTGEDDHVHLLVEQPPTVQVSRLVNSLTGVLAAAAILVAHHRDHLWSPSYLAASCGRAPLSIIREYVGQRRPT
ncbi:MAG: IS200/IS605 family transposase [Pseudonocardia sp.]